MHFRCSYAEEMTFPHRALVAFSHCSHLFPSGLEMLLSQGNWLEPSQSFLMSEKFKSPSRTGHDALKSLGGSSDMTIRIHTCFSCVVVI